MQFIYQKIVCVTNDPLFISHNLVINYSNNKQSMKYCFIVYIVLDKLIFDI
jgi:hypothetical protein